MKAWSKKLVEREMMRIRDELQDVESRVGPKGRLEAILRGIHETKDELSRMGNLRCYIYVVSALTHQTRHGGLKTKQLESLVALAHALLKIQGVTPITSKIGFLYGYVHLSLSQIHRNDGKPFPSAWEQGLSHYLSLRSPVGGEAYQALSTGIRSLRLGHADLAIEQFKIALKGDLSDYHKARCYLEIIKAYRLSARLDEAEALEPEIAKATLSPEERAEVTWERNCRKAVRTGDIDVLISAIKNGRPHSDPSYAREVFFWTRATRSRKWLTRFSTIRSFVSYTGVGIKKRDFMFECIKTLEQCYDSDIPLVIRLRNLGKSLNSRSKLFNVDIELLFLATSLRWLFRSRSYGLAKLVAYEYRSYCLKLSGGRSGDVLGFAQDILSHPKIQGTVGLEEEPIEVAKAA